MEPTIQNGAAIIINTSRNEAMDGDIFVVRIGDRLWVKRTQWLTDGGLRLISDNHIYEKMDVSAVDLQHDNIEVMLLLIFAILLICTIFLFSRLTL